jgi:transcriptional regulator with XRE-family HTH domain
MSKLNENIRKYREQLGLSQEDLAIIMGYKSRSSINKIESGENDIPQSKIIAFAKALHTTPALLMGWGEREQLVTETDDEFEKEVIRCFGSLSKLQKSEALRYLQDLSRSTKKK